MVGILGDLGIEYDSDPRIIEALNKVDRTDESVRTDINRQQNFADNKVMISALNGEGLNRLLEKIAGVLSGARIEAMFKIPQGDGAAPESTVAGVPPSVPSSIKMRNAGLTLVAALFASVVLPVMVK